MLIKTLAFRPTTEIREQRLLWLELPIQHARLLKIKECLEAMKSDLKEVESAMLELNKMAEGSRHAQAAPGPSATEHPPAVEVNDRPIELPAACGRRTDHDPISHGLICQKLLRQFALLSTSETATTCS